jgi:hypothetical protein
MPDRQRLLELALQGLEAERAKIDGEIAQIKSQLSSPPTVVRNDTADTSDTALPKRRRRMSAAARKKISEAMKRRHAEARKAVKKSH